MLNNLSLVLRPLIVVLSLSCCCMAQPVQVPTPRPKLLMGHAMQWSMPGSNRFSRSPFLANKTQSYYENAPLIFPANPDDKGALVQMFFDAKASGLDAINMHVHNESAKQLQKMMHRLLDAAQESKTDVKIFPLIAGIMKVENFSQFLKIMWQDPYTKQHPNFLRIDGKPVVITYGHRGAKQWQEAIANAKAGGGEFFIINDTSCLEIGVTEKVPVEKLKAGIEPCDGLYYFASGTLGLPNHEQGPLASFMDFGHSFNPPKYTGASVRQGYIGATRVGNLLSPRGTKIFRMQWLEVLKNNPDFVHLTTLNDYGEGTSQECSVNNTFTFIDMNRYFSHRWKTGQWPKLDKPQAFLSYRKAVVAGEPIQFELVLLTADMASHDYAAILRLDLPDQSSIECKSERVEKMPGHVVMHFQAVDGIKNDGFAIPRVSVKVDGKVLKLSDANAAPFSIVKNGEEVLRKWLRVPLHRLAENIAVKLAVKGSPANLYPRSVFLENVPWDQTAGYIIERGGHSLHNPLDAKPINKNFGYLEMFDEGFGWSPMRFYDVKNKRRVMDMVDRYTAVIRLKNDTIVFAQPTQMDAPHVDSSTVLDLLIQPRRGLLRDRGIMNRDYNMQKQIPATRPKVVRPRQGKPWALRFDGVDDCLTFGPLNMPAGPVTLELWINPADNDKPAVICDQKGAALGLAIMHDRTLRLMRVDINRKAVMLNGQIVLKPKQWHHVVCVYDGRAINLYVNGQADGQPVACRGLRTDEGMFLGKDACSVWSG